MGHFPKVVMLHLPRCVNVTVDANEDIRNAYAIPYL